MKYRFEFVVGNSDPYFTVDDAIKLVKEMIEKRGVKVVDDMAIYRKMGK